MIETGIIVALISLLGILLRLNSRKEYKDNLEQHAVIAKTVTDGFLDLSGKLDTVIIDTHKNTEELKSVTKELNRFKKERSFKGDISEVFSEALIMTIDEKLISILTVLKTKTLDAIRNRISSGFDNVNPTEIDMVVNNLTQDIANMIELSYGKKTLDYIMGNMEQCLIDYKKDLIKIFNDEYVNNIIGRYRSEVLNLLHKLIAEISRGSQMKLDE